MRPSLPPIAVLAALAPLALSLAACRPHDFPQYAPDYREYAYVTNSGSGTVSIVDVVNVRLDRELAVGLNPVAVAAAPARNEVYVVCAGAENGQGSLVVIDAEKNAVAAVLPLHRRPVALEVDAAGETAYVANAGSNSVSVVDLKTRRETALIGAGEQPSALRLSPDGRTLAVANRGGDSVTLIDPAARSVRAVFNGCPGAADVVILPDSSKAFVACAGGHQILSVALARAQGKPGVEGAEAARPDRVEALMDVGRGPVQLALKPDGGELFSLNSLSDSISEVITSTNDVGGAYMMGAGPARGLVTADNALLYVANQRSQEVTLYAVEDGKRRGVLHVGDGPSALALSTAGHLLFVADSRSGDVAVVRTASRSLFTLIPAGRNPCAIAVKAFHAH
jgi:YVTN family beta-propeller protein